MSVFTGIFKNMKPKKSLTKVPENKCECRGGPDPKVCEMHLSFAYDGNIPKAERLDRRQHVIVNWQARS